MSTLLLDLDGTLTDSSPGIVRSLQYAMRRVGRPAPPEDELRPQVGPPLHETIAHLLGDDADEALQQQAIAAYRERFVEKGMFENAVYDGIVTALQQLKARGLRLLVATSKPHVYARPIIEHYGLAAFFDAVYGSELDGTRGNKGELIAWLMARESLQTDGTMMVGDREHDILGAKRNGLRSAGVLWGYGGLAELQAAGADQLLGAPAELGTVAFS